MVTALVAHGRSEGEPGLGIVGVEDLSRPTVGQGEDPTSEEHPPIGQQHRGQLVARHVEVRQRLPHRIRGGQADRFGTLPGRGGVTPSDQDARRVVRGFEREQDRGAVHVHTALRRGLRELGGGRIGHRGGGPVDPAGGHLRAGDEQLTIGQQERPRIEEVVER